MSPDLVVGLLVGLAAGTAAGWAVASARGSRSASAAAAAARQRTGELERELAVAAARVEQLQQDRDDRTALWEEARRHLAGELADLSQAVLARSSEQLLQLADARFRHAQESAAADLVERQRAIEQVLAPLREQLDRYEAGLARLESDRHRAQAELGEQVRQLAASQERMQAATRDLVTALRVPATRGRWGEVQLRRVVEMAGMVAHCDFEEQVTVPGEDGTGQRRPDMVVRLPGGRQVVVDAKVPLQAFLEAAEAEDERERRVRLAAHARQLRAHVDDLSKKAYWQQFERSPDLVVAFVPGDALLAAALEHDATLLEHAMANRVLLATPTTLVALLRSIAYGWQHQELAANAVRVSQLGQELHRRLAAFADHLARVGRGLRSAVGAYNDAVGSLERSVLPQARRFGELGVVGTGARPLPEPDSVDLVARTPDTAALTDTAALAGTAGGVPRAGTPGVTAPDGAGPAPA